MRAAPTVDRYFASPAAGDLDVVAVTREFLGAARDFLTDLHRSGALGHRVDEAHSNMMDRLVRRLFQISETNYFTNGVDSQAVFTVVAVGGYGRRELNMHSDVDLLFLYEPPLSAHVEAIARGVQYWLWDASLQVGCATRTITETIELARDDTSVLTSILGPRYLAGSGVLFHQFVRRVRGELFADPTEFVAEQLESLRERHKRHGDSLYLLQPNIKEAAGGLRDYHSAYWAVQAMQPGGGRIDDFLHVGLLTEEESREYLSALDFLWRVRNEAHLCSGRKTDELGFELQEQIAAALGYASDEDVADDENGVPQLPVELFMGDYYRSARIVQSYSLLAIEQCCVRVRGQSVRADRSRDAQEVEEGFRVVEGRLEIPHGRLLADKPRRLLAAFAVAQDHEVPLTRKALRLIRENLHQIDDAYRRDPECIGLFLRILDSERWVMRALMTMNEVGLLGQFVPEWQHIVCRWQHVMYHTYTVDVHTIFLVEELRRLWKGDYERQQPEMTEMMRNVEDRPVLFLGCLFHDIGKGFGGNHSLIGSKRARASAERLGFSAERIERVVFLVEQHLLMSHLAQSRDLSDPRLILDFARIVGNRTNLRDLYLVTFADIRASSTRAWTDWKGQLLQELFERTSELLETGSDDPNTAMELIERRVEQRRESALAELSQLGVAASNIEEYFEAMPRRYFTAHTPRQIARHALVAIAFDPDRVMSTAVREMRGDFSELIVCAEDRSGLYADVAGVLTAHHINILGSHVYTTNAGLALEVYRVGTPRGGAEARRLIWDDFQTSMKRLLHGELSAKELLKKRGRLLGHQKPPGRAPVGVRITNDESDFYTIADIRANDRVGLLHDLTRVIADRGFLIFISKAATVLDQVADTFYLKNHDGKKISDPDAIEALRVDLLEVVSRDLDGAAG
ncbi:MAG: [protein-PII] uridylyltransferase [Myxococcota bacterium]